MLIRRMITVVRMFRVLALILSFGWLTGVAYAGTPFDPNAFAAAQATGRPVLVEVHADWCPVCVKQQPVISELLSQPRFRQYQVLTVDFDSQKDALRALGVRYQSTLIVFKGKQEVARSTGETAKDKLAELLAKAI